MISHDHKIVFIHIGRTGGTSIETAFEKPLQNHSTYHEMRERLGINLWREYFKFSIVRNPWERLVSGYQFLIKNGLLQGTLVDLNLSPDENMAFGTFVKKVHENHPDPYTFMRVDKPLFETQCYWLYDEQDSLVVDYVGRFETLRRDFYYICNKNNIDKNLPHVNKTYHAHYSTYYDDESQKIVADWYKIDVERFKYTFETKPTFSSKPYWL